MEQLTLFAADSRVSQCLSPGNKWARRMTAGSGLKCSAFVETQGPVGSLLKMCLASLRWNSTACLLTWKAKATRQGRLYFRLAASAPRTDENGFGLWATPAAAVAREFYPTPTTQDAKNNGSKSQQARNTPPLNAVAGGPLNPNWVEWLMGYPAGWTDLER